MTPMQLMQGLSSHTDDRVAPSEQSFEALLAAALAAEDIART